MVTCFVTVRICFLPFCLWYPASGSDMSHNHGHQLFVVGDGEIADSYLQVIFGSKHTIARNNQPVWYSGYSTLLPASKSFLLCPVNLNSWDIVESPNRTLLCTNISYLQCTQWSTQVSRIVLLSPVIDSTQLTEIANLLQTITASGAQLLLPTTSNVIE